MTETPRITIDSVRATTPVRPVPGSAKPTVARPTATRTKRAVGLGADLTHKPDIPSNGSSTLVAALLGLGGLAFALGVGLTLILHRPDLLHLGAVDAPALIDLSPPEEPAPPQVTRSVSSFMGVGPAEASIADAEPPKQDLTSGIVLTEEQQRNIASVLALASGERAQRTAPTLSEAALTRPEMTKHTVAAGDTLGTIATRYYGNATAYQPILEANVDQLRDPNRLSVGMSLVIPTQ